MNYNRIVIEEPEATSVMVSGDLMKHYVGLALKEKYQRARQNQPSRAWEIASTVGKAVSDFLLQEVW